MLVLFVVVSAGVGYFVGTANQRTVTSISTTTMTLPSGQFNQCGFANSCSASGPSGVVLTLSINTTVVRSNNSFTFDIEEFNPTDRSFNLSKADNWYLSSLTSAWFCYNGVPPYGFAVFRGYYTLQNVSSAVNVIKLGIYGCIYTGNPTAFSFPPRSTFVPIGTISLGYLQGSLQVYAINGDCVKSGSLCNMVYSLGSSKPTIYTMATGDEWGDLVLLHFSVVDNGQ